MRTAHRLEAVCQLGLEDLVKEHRDRPYEGGRSKHWIKVKNRMHPAMKRVMDIQPRSNKAA
jgi:ATP-dependent DNA ligase